ncbi:hypothetical protein BGZ47_007783 [Haplosporangium gracile]|nr:hypothetical protein BGZ47_007783 [Haplosporangium gracile]
MSFAFQRIFDIPELVDLLISQLDKAEVSVLARINKAIRKVCNPWLYKALNFCYHNKHNDLGFVPGMVALGWNIRHVKELTLEPDELAFYYNCVYDFEEIHGQFGNNNNTLTSRLAWHDAGTAVLINPHLTHLRFNPIYIKDPNDGRRLVQAVAGMQRIRESGLWIDCRQLDAYRLGMNLFYCVKPSIRSFIMSLYQDHNDDAELDQNSSGVSGDGLMTLSRRQESLVDLETLAL